MKRDYENIDLPFDISSLGFRLDKNDVNDHALLSFAIAFYLQYT